MRRVRCVENSLRIELSALPEIANVEVAHALSEPHALGVRHERWHEVMELFEVAILAIVAIATAWSGFQSAKWDGHQSLLYAQASAHRFEATSEATLGGQSLAADTALFTAWLQAQSADNTDLQNRYVARFTPEYRVGFDAWLKTDPFNNPAAVPGPAYTPEYRNTRTLHAAQLNAQATTEFDEGTHSRETGEKYVRNTVLLATVLFLVAVGQRMKSRPSRISAAVVAMCVLLFVIVSTLDLPRL